MNNEDNVNDLAEFEFGEFEDASVQTGVVNGNVPSKLFQQIPCTIAFTYTRFEADGSVKPCCVSPFSLGNVNSKSFEDVWHSAEYNAWRAKFLTIHKKKFHLHDAEFSFCQMCPHIPLNVNTAKNISENWEDEKGV